MHPALTSNDDVLVDTKTGLFWNLEKAHEPVMSAPAVRALRAVLEAQPDLLPPDEHARAAAALKAIAALPIRSFVTPNEMRARSWGVDEATNGRTGGLKVHGVTAVARKVNSLGQATGVTGDPSSWGWRTAAALATEWPVLEKLVQSSGVRVLLPPAAHQKKLARFMDDWANGTLVIKSLDAAEALAEGVSYALYVPGDARRPNDHGGYLHRNGWAASLAGAQLFENPTAARRTRASRAVSQALLVRVNVRLDTRVPEIGRDTPTPTGLASALSIADRRALQRVQDESDTERLKARIAELEERLARLEPASDLLQQAAPRVRKM